MTVHAVIGTAGHVDHGKTSLVRALTGIDCDRLADEKRRGITIELGFARWDLPGYSASIVDVPGHESFVRTMVAGAAGLDLVMLVIAADDGVMPQTREHLAICEELGVRSGVTVITKADLVDTDLLDLVTDEIEGLTRGTFLEGRPIVRCSVRDGSGLDVLTATVARALCERRATPTDGPAWLAIDRVFTKHGFGTIVTGTLVQGTISVDDELEVLASSGGGIAPVVVRGLSVHGEPVERARATTRLAVNLRGVDRSELERGAVLASPGWQRPTHAIDVELRIFEEAPPFDDRTELVLHVGTAHATVRARSLSGAGLAPGQRCVARLVSKAPIAVYAGQRLVVRRPELDENRTVAGGTVLDPHPHLGRRRRGRLAAPSLLASAELADRVRAMVEESGRGATRSALAERLPPETPVGRITHRLVSRGALVEVGHGDSVTFYSSSQLERAKTAILASLEAFHREHPAASGATVAELVGMMPISLRALASEAASALARDGAVRGEERYCLPSHDTRRLCDRVAEVYRARGLEPGTDEAMREQSELEARAFRDVLAELVREGRLARVANGLHFHATALDEVRERVRAHFEANETLSPGEFKELTGLTRRSAIAILEWLDARGVTRRDGDRRVRA